jgi:hypothetical protein
VRDGRIAAGEDKGEDGCRGEGIKVPKLFRLCLETQYFNIKVLVNHSFQDGRIILKYFNITIL